MYFQDEDFNFSVTLLYEQKLLRVVKQYVYAEKIDNYELTVKVVDKDMYGDTYLTNRCSIIFYGWNAANIDFYYRSSFNNLTNFKALESFIRLYYRLVNDDTYVNIKIIQCEYVKKCQILFDANMFDILASVLVEVGK
jgi:hypothetical protein